MIPWVGAIRLVCSVCNHFENGGGEGERRGLHGRTPRQEKTVCSYPFDVLTLLATHFLKFIIMYNVMIIGIVIIIIVRKL